jgi:uncharacterized repeat protein (TIGR02543 family)
MCRYSSNSKSELARYRLAGIFYGLIAVLLLGAFGSVLAEVNVSISRGLTISDNDSVDTGDAGYDTTPDVVGVSSASLTSEGQSAELGYRFSGYNAGRGVWNGVQAVRSITQSIDVYVEWTITATAGEIYSFSLDPELHGYLNILDDNNSEADDIAEISNFNATLTQNGSNIINDQLGLTGGSRDTVGSSNIDDAASRSFGGLEGVNTFRLQYTGSMLAAWKIAGFQDNRTANAVLWGRDGTMDGDSFAATFDNYATTAVRDADGLFVKGTVAVTSVPDAGQSVISVTSPHIADGNDTALVTVQVKDASGNNLAAGGAAVVVSGDGSALVSGVTDNDDGTYTATVTNAVAETVTISATLSGASITSGDPTIEFQPPLTTQIDLSPVFNADIVRGQDDAGSFDPCCAFVSSSVASANGSPAEDGLPDDGVFTAAAEYPRVELAAFNESGDNAWKVTGTPAFTASVTPGNYNELHVFASAGDAGVGKFATFRLTVTYADGSRKSGEFEVADWFDDNAIVTDTRYYLINDMDRWNGSSYEDANNPAVFGFRLPLESNRVSQAFTIDLLTNTVGTVAVLGAVATTDSTTDTTFYWIDTTVAPNGGGEISCTNNPVPSGGSSTCAVLPSPGFTFAGWSGACSGAGDCILSNVTNAAAVTAAFTPTSGYVVVSTDASTGGSLDPVGRSVPSGSAAVFNVEPDLGYQIDAVSGCGGSLNTSVSPNTYTTGAVTSDCTVTASFSNEFTLTFDSNGGSAVSPITQVVGTTVTAPAAPTRSGYAFAGWSPAVPATMPAENLSLTAQWTANSYTLNFDAQGGSVSPSSKGVTYDQPIGTLPVPTRTGYTFSGWDTAADGSGATWTAATVYTTVGNSALHAQWTPNVYTLTFDAQGGSVTPSSKSVIFDAAIGSLPSPTRTGYTFAGWNTAANGSGATWTAATVYTTVGGSLLYAQWTVDQYTITFDSNGGTVVAPITQDFGTTITAPTDPTREGYTFSGWSPAVPATMPAENRTLTAQWNVDQYNVTVSVNPPAGGSVNGAGTYDFGSPVSVQATAASGYEFVSWTEAGDPVSALTSYTFAMPAVDRDLTADFSLISYSLAVINGTGDGDYVPGTEVGIAAAAPPEGQVFDAWTGDIEFLIDPTVPNAAVTMPEQAITLTATYKASPPEAFALNVANGSGAGEYMAGSQVTITANPAPDGKVFDRWIGDVGFVTNANLPTTDVIMPEAEVAVEATYKAAPPETFALIVNAGSGSGEYEAGRVVSIAADPPPEDQIFDRWSGDIAYLDSALNPNTTVVMPGQTITLTAIYKNRPAEKFELTVRSGSGGGEYPAGQTVTVAANSAPEGQVFDRWRGDTAFLVSVNVPNTQVVMPAEAVVIEAAYKVSPPKTFVLSVNSGTGSGDYEAGEVITVAAEPAAEGEVFARWSGQTAQVTNVNLPNTTLTMPAADVSITADYESEPADPQPNVLTVVDGTGDGEYEAGRVILIAADVREGEIFDRWIGQTATVNNVNIPNTVLLMPNGDATVTATFKSDPEQQFQLRVRQRLPESAAPASRASHDKATEQTIIEERAVPAGLLLRLVAPAPPGGLIFDKWIGQTTHVDNINKTDTFLYMPSNDVDVTATYREPVSPQTLVVESGSGDGNYLEGTAVTITANAAPAGFVFERWEGQTAQVANVNRPETTLEMPQTSVRVRSVYRPLPQETFGLDVIGGSGDGSYVAGSEVSIVSQTPPPDQVFARWAGQVGTVDDIFAERARVYMPTTEVTIVAQFANVYEVTAALDGAGGTVGPASQEVGEGDRATFRLVPDSGWVVDSVTGCGGGTLSGNTWTTDQIDADCRIVVRFALVTEQQVIAVPVDSRWALFALVLMMLGVASRFGFGSVRRRQAR